MDRPTRYKLLHSQEMVTYMRRFTIHNQSTQISASMLFEEAFDFDLLTRALNVEIARNDCMRLRLVRTLSGTKQYFLPSYKITSVPFYRFSSDAERDRVLDREAAKALNVYGGETYSIIFYVNADGRSGIFLRVTHFVMDAAATFTFYRDLLAVYDSLKDGTPMPRPLTRFEDVIKKEVEDSDLPAKLAVVREKVKERLYPDKPPFFCAPNGPKLIERDRKLLLQPNLTVPMAYAPFRDKTNFLKLRLSEADSEKIAAFVKENRLSAEWVIQLGMRLALSAANDRVNDSVFLVLCPRRRTVAEKRCGGEMASPMAWREILDESETFREGLKRLSVSQLELFRLADIPTPELRKIEGEIFGHLPVQCCASMMFSFLPLEPDAMGGRAFEYVGANFGHYIMPLYVITIKDPKSGRYVFSYVHRLSQTTDAEIEYFHNRVVKAILLGVEDPARTLGDILDSI